MNGMSRRSRLSPLAVLALLVSTSGTAPAEQLTPPRDASASLDPSIAITNVTVVDVATGNHQGQLKCAHARQSCTRIASREGLTVRPSASYAMNPSLRNFFRKTFTRDRVVPTISARDSCEIAGNTRCG
jgi:hypothetical protein